jgi:hypothetical protein
VQKNDREAATDAVVGEGEPADGDAARHVADLAIPPLP